MNKIQNQVTTPYSEPKCNAVIDKLNIVDDKLRMIDTKVTELYDIFSFVLSRNSTIGNNDCDCDVSEALIYESTKDSEIYDRLNQYDYVSDSIIEKLNDIRERCVV